MNTICVIARMLLELECKSESFMSIPERGAGAGCLLRYRFRSSERRVG